ncbi:hypothetical protein GCM10007860_25950 [Chitiniphilus shinanonensis]|uniref:MafI family immunity protein n=1 Tax=Chitiniphilus shinanonensis TaxID=553088 RepID=A0ABQ6BVF2_9NEIS|nr:MafI family immunity protein [Chitiniphilus shinanonensis]GLS05442.1 hypothetical protein GCM10007860_25950 [Chitiniphilus shinanonensis]
MDMLEERIFNFGEKFKGRLDSLILDGALDYMNHNEVPLAFEILCDHICEYEISLSEIEYLEAMDLARDMNFDVTLGPYKHLKNLVVR